MAENGFNRTSNYHSSAVSKHTIRSFFPISDPLPKSIPSFAIPLVLALLVCLCFPPGLRSQKEAELHQRQFNTLYIEGKCLFYEILKREAEHVQILDKDRKMLVKAQKKIPGLYEHLMNFYYCHTRPDEKRGVNFRSHLLDFTKNMAGEFIQSITEFTPNEKASPLESVLYSTGYFSRQMFPIFRDYRRPVSRRAKANWALEELKVSEAHSFSRGEGIKLAIIDSGVDPTLQELRSRITALKNFLDGSKPAFDKGKFPYDWSGHGTSIATVVFQVAPGVELAIVKVYDNETMSTVPPSRWSTYLFAAGMIWATQNGANIINLSAAFQVDTKAIREASQYCWENNVVVVSPIANVTEDEHEKTLYFPAAYPWTIAVGGVEKSNGKLRVSALSSEAVYLDVVAPASGFVVEMPSYLDRRRRPAMAFGNSLAVPFVAGTAALILSAMEDQTLLKLKEKPGQLVEAVREILRQTSSNTILGFDEPNPVSGYGCIDIIKAVEAAQNLKVKNR
ncbi:MAG: S8 family serine peptidase [Candidatus Aminicenantes bacterium]|nr:S8 family serine peptidase [Candidatus Aminicenantes bacterium]